MTMNIPAISTFILAIVSLIFSVLFLFHLNDFSKHHSVGVGTVVGRKEKQALVRFHKGSRLITAPASVFDDTPIAVGEKVILKYLEIGPNPMKWDLRIVGKNGYGQKKIRTVALSLAGLSIASFCLTAFFLSTL